jgi:UDP-GlcNAc3NAcA epimerase
LIKLIPFKNNLNGIKNILLTKIKTMKLSVIVGARPQFMKMAVMYRAIQKYNQENSDNLIQETLIHTGQHYDHGMSQIFFEEMDLPVPEINLGLSSGLQGEMTGAMIIGLEKELLSNRPDCVLVFGDTNSTLAGALAASKLHIPVAHIESGLRSFNRKMSEEINRIVVDSISDYLFCPCPNAVGQLQKENVSGKIFNSGDVLYDSFLHYQKRAIKPKFKEPFALATLHRAENTDDLVRLRSILSALEKSPLPILFPLHPRTKKELSKNKIILGQQIQTIEPLSYFSMLGHLANCSFVITDSGGVQKEAYFSGKRCLTVRDETEWTELIDSGFNKLVGSFDKESEAKFDWAFRPIEKGPCIYGNGNAGEYILNKLVNLPK